jgi:hypothetical protein
MVIGAHGIADNKCRRNKKNNEENEQQEVGKNEFIHS